MKRSGKYTDSEKLTVCILYEFFKSSQRVAESIGMERSSVQYIIKNNPSLRKKAQEIVLEKCEGEAEDFAVRIRDAAMKAIEKLLCAVTGDSAISKSNSQQLAFALGILMDKFAIMPVGGETKESGGVVILPEIEKKG